jgi:hypothetical protein
MRVSVTTENQVWTVIKDGNVLTNRESGIVEGRGSRTAATVDVANVYLGKTATLGFFAGRIYGVIVVEGLPDVYAPESYLASLAGATMARRPAITPSGITIASAASQINGDPFLVWDGSQWIMYYFETVSGAPYQKTRYKTGPTLQGPWSAAADLGGFSGYGKMVLLVDENGVPVQVNGTYHAYAASYTGTINSKETYHFTCATLLGTWTNVSKVIAKGSAGTLDEYFADTPYAVYKDGVTYLWYMGAPSGLDPTYGRAIRLLRATAADPAGPFTKDYTDAVPPGSVTTSWRYGWVGGCQVRAHPTGGYFMILGASSLRPSSAGNESGTCRNGIFYSSSIDGPWTEDAHNPVMGPEYVVGPEASCVWRPHLAVENGQWTYFYNTGPGGTEVITYGSMIL